MEHSIEKTMKHSIKETMEHSIEETMEHSIEETMEHRTSRNYKKSRIVIIWKELWIMEPSTIEPI